MIPTRNRARLEILNYIINFSTYKWYDRGNSDESRAFTHPNIDELKIDSLCTLSSGPFTKYYLSWLKEIKLGNNQFEHQYLMESIEDGSLCWWSNISIYVYPNETVSLFPQWRWTDRQFEFWDKWERVCKKRDAYIVLPKMPEFTENGGVILSTRIRFGLDDEVHKKEFKNWKGIKQTDMLSFYDEAVLKHEKKLKLRKEP